MSQQQNPPSLIALSALSEITKGDVELKPWKYIGYRGFSSFVASDNDFFFLRRFGTLHARVLLALQDEITVLEDRLRALDVLASRKCAPDRHNGSFRFDKTECPERTGLMWDIYQKLGQYSKSQTVSREI
jgi:hypothetical protein